MEMTKAQKDEFLSVECVIMTAKYLNIIQNGSIFLDQIDELNDEILQKSPEVAKQLQHFQQVYEEWFNVIVMNKNPEISYIEIEIIIKKDKAREMLTHSCIQYRKENDFPPI